jgi:hypothetical protein
MDASIKEKPAYVMTKQVAAVAVAAAVYYVLGPQNSLINGYWLLYFVSGGLILLCLYLLITARLYARPTKPWVGAGDFLSGFLWDGKRPLKITFLAWGVRGDLQPNIALGLELAKRGLQVTVLGSERYRSIIECHPDLTYQSCEDSHVQEVIGYFNKFGFHMLKGFGRYVQQSSIELIPQYYKAAVEADVVRKLYGFTNGTKQKELAYDKVTHPPPPPPPPPSFISSLGNILRCA